VRFRWEEDEGTKYFFEMTITIDEITNDLSLNITDFARKETKTKADCIGIISSKIYK
jgi:hypothetical protein